MRIYITDEPNMPGRIWEFPETYGIRTHRFLHGFIEVVDRIDEAGSFKSVASFNATYIVAITSNTDNPLPK